MGPIEEAIRETFFLALFGGEDIDTEFRKILGHRVKCGGLGILHPRPSEECAYNNFKEASEELVDSLLGGTALNYAGNRDFLCRAIVGVRKYWQHMDMSELGKQKELEGGQERNRLHRATRNGAWLSATPH